MPSDDAQNPSTATPAGNTHTPAQTGPGGSQPELPPDPGSRAINWLLWPLIIVLFVLTFMEQHASNIGTRLQQSQQTQQQGQPQGQPPAPPEAPPPPDPFALEETDQDVMFGAITRIIVKIGHALKVQDPSAPIGNFVEALDQQRQSQLDQLRTAMAAAELQDDVAALKRLDDLDATAPPAATGAPVDRVPDAVAPAIRADSETLRLIYSGKKADLTTEQRDLLKEHHGKLGEIALTFKDSDTGARAELMAGGERLLFLLAFAVFGGLIALVSGFILFPIFIIMFATRRWRPRFVPPARGGSVFLETFAVFLLAFLGLKLGTDTLIDTFPIGPNRHWPMYASLAAQWLLVPVIFWPRLRGMSASAWSSAVGLHAGRGVFREIGAGIVGYLAGIPILILALICTAVMLAVRGALNPEAAAPSNPIKDFLQQADMAEQLLLALAAVAWAPLVEEAMFRGGIYRHLRSYMHWIIVAVISAVIFGLMHGYDVIILLPVITLGFNFALMREWRGSIIASMTAHALHNGAIMTLAIVAINSLQ